MYILLRSCFLLIFPIHFGSKMPTLEIERVRERNVKEEENKIKEEEGEKK